MCGVRCALALGGWLDREQERLADQVIRLHVIANSDSPEDQRGEGNKAADTGIRDSYAGYVSAALSSMLLMSAVVAVKMRKKK